MTVDHAGDGPRSAATEREVVAWLVGVTGLPAGAGGLLTPGGSTATLAAVVAARHAVLGGPAASGTMYVTDRTDHAVARAARLGGLPESAIREVATGGDLRTPPDAVRARIHADRERGRRPFMIVATAGTTSTGTVDDLDALADVARDEGVWLHVDAARGGFFALTSRGAARLRGTSRADSVALDPHEGLFLPRGTGALVVRDGAALRRAHTPAPEDPVRPRDLAPGDEAADERAERAERGREGRGLRLWLPLRRHGVAAFRAALDEKLDLAALLHAWLAHDPRFEAPWPPDLATVVFRCTAGDRATDQLRDRLSSEGDLRCTVVDLPGGRHVRLHVMSSRTHREHIEAALAAIDRAAGPPTVLTRATWESVVLC